MIVMAALSTNAAISNNASMLERTARVAYHTMHLTEPELEWLETSRQVPNGAAWADSLRAYKGEVSLAFLNGFIDDMLRAFEKQKMQATDAYRLMLVTKSIGHDTFYEYEEKDETIEKLRENIARYITAPDERRGWELFTDLSVTEYYSERVQWMPFTLNRRIARFLASKPDISDGLRFIFYEHLLTSAVGNIYAQAPKDIRDIISQFEKLALKMWPEFGQIILDSYEPTFLEAKIVSDPDNALLEVMQLTRIADEGTLTPYESFTAYMTLSNYYTYKGDDVESQKYLDKLRNTTQTMAEIYRRPNSATNAVCYQKLIIPTDDQSGHDREIYEELKQQFGDSKYAKRCLAAALRDFIENRTGQTSELPSLQASMDYYELVKDDPYAPYRFGNILSASLDIACSGQVAEGAKLIEDLEPSTPYETVLLALDKTNRELFFNNRPETLFDAAMEAYETNHSTGYNSDEDDQILINHMANAVCNTFDSERIAILKPLVADVSARLGIKPWETFAEWDIAIAETNMIPDISKRISAFKTLLARAEKKEIFEKAWIIAYKLSLAYVADNKVKDAETAIEKALTYSDYNGFNIPLYNEYLSFLHDVKSDYPKWRKMLSTVVADAERMHLDLQFSFLQLIVTQLGATMNNLNMEDLYDLMGLLYEKGGKMAQICQGDEYAIQQAMNIMLPMFAQLFILMDNSYQCLSDGDKENLTPLFDSMKENYYTDFILGNLELIENGYNNNEMQNCYNRINLCWMFMIFEGEEKAEEYLEQTKGLAGEAGLLDYFKAVFDELDFSLAWRRHDFDSIERMTDTPEFWEKVKNQSISVRRITNQLTTLINTKFVKEDYAGAQKLAEKRQDIVQEYIDRQFIDMSEAQREALFQNGMASTVHMNTALRYNPSAKAATKAYDATLYYRNLLLSSSQSLRRAVYDSGDSTQVADYERMLQLRALNSKGSSSIGLTKEESLAISRNSREARELEDSVYSRAARAGLLESRRTYKYADVAKALADDEVAIEFIADLDNYGALIARKGFKAPVYVPLLSATELRELLQHTRNTSLKTGMQKLYAWRSDGKKTYRGIWEPIEPYLAGAKVIYYTPDNDLNQISFAAIEDSTRTSLCEKYDLRLVSSTGNLAARAQAAKKKKDRRPQLECVAIGGVPYDLDAARDPQRKGVWHALPNTKVEVARFDSICRAAGISARLYTGDGTREENFRALSGSSPDILLLATHGYYLSPEQAAKMPYFIGKGLTKENEPNFSIEAMNRGGLILADANPVWVNERNMADDVDGVLTASEIATLNLSHTKLVILSACETALGSNSILCGVNGLQRGFKLAGVNSIIMSLWEVNDAAGEKFMNEFYTQFFATGDRYEAFRKARLKLKEEYPRDPSLWAPFIMLD